MRSITATSARGDLFNVIKYSVKTHQPCRITSRAGEAILISKEDFESLIETLELLSTPGVVEDIRKARNDIKAGRVYSLKEVFGS